MVPNAADMLMSLQMRDLIAELQGEFDYIVMDTSPLPPVVDALALATVADKVLVIVEWGQTPITLPLRFPDVHVTFARRG